MWWHSEGLPQHHPPSCPHPKGQPCSSASLEDVPTGRKHFLPTSPWPPHNTHWCCSLPTAGAGGGEDNKSSSGETFNLSVAGFKVFSPHPFRYFTGVSCSTLHTEKGLA